LLRLRLRLFFFVLAVTQQIQQPRLLLPPPFGFRRRHRLPLPYLPRAERRALPLCLLRRRPRECLQGALLRRDCRRRFLLLRRNQGGMVGLSGLQLRSARVTANCCEDYRHVRLLLLHHCKAARSWRCVELQRLCMRLRAFSARCGSGQRAGAGS
jgi:hypothetical protein